MRSLAILLLVSTVLAVRSAAAEESVGASVPPVSFAAPPSPKTHRFWDTTNVLLFTGVAGSRAYDYASTRHFRRRGVHEALLNDAMVDNKPLFVAIEAAGTAAQIGACVFLHNKGHHKLERWISVVHIGITIYGATRNYGLGKGITPK